MKHRQTVLVLTTIAMAVAGCGRPVPRFADFGGHPVEGSIVIGRAACGSCHAIPGISDARGMVGPPLGHIAERTIIAGVLPNTPPNMVHWLKDPQSVIPGNAMPNSHLSDQEARDVAAYLYTLR